MRGKIGMRFPCCAVRDIEVLLVSQPWGGSFLAKSLPFEEKINYRLLVLFVSNC